MAGAGASSLAVEQVEVTLEVSVRANLKSTHASLIPAAPKF